MRKHPTKHGGINTLRSGTLRLQVKGVRQLDRKDIKVIGEKNSGSQ